MKAISKRKVIIFPKQSQPRLCSPKQDPLSLADWLETIDSLRQEDFKDDLEMFLNIVWLHQYLLLAGQGRLEADGEVLDRLSEFVEMAASYLCGRFNIPGLLNKLKNHTQNGCAHSELYERLCAFVQPYLFETNT